MTRLPATAGWSARWEREGIRTVGDLLDRVTVIRRLPDRVNAQIEVDGVRLHVKVQPGADPGEAPREFARRRMRSGYFASDGYGWRITRDADDKLVPRILVAETARDLGARSVTLVAPYLGYMRQDARFRPGEVRSEHHALGAVRLGQRLREGAEAVFPPRDQHQTE